MTERPEFAYDPRAYAEAVGYYTPSVFAERLGVRRWQFDQGRRKGVVPAPDRTVGHYDRWSVTLVETVAEELSAAVVAAAGTERAVGASKVADRLRARTGRDVLADDVRHLADRGFLPVVDMFTGVGPARPLYDVRDADRIPLHEVVRSVAGRERRIAECTFLNQHQCRRRLGGLRKTDWNHIVRRGWITPVTSEQVRVDYGTRSGRKVVDVLLYRASDVDDLLNRPDVDWAGLLALKPGAPSPLRGTASPEGFRHEERSR